jgi:hypothetical protein
MKHYRILEKKGKTKQYIIQYLSNLIFGLSYWKTYYDSTQPVIYDKYEEALTAVKKIIVQKDYETPIVGYHYIDAYKIFKTIKK